MARRTFLSTWTVTVTIGEAIGYCAPALAGVWTTSRGIDGLQQAFWLAASGLVEGACLGAAQHRALRGEVDLPRAPWIVGTAIAASLTWFAIMSVRLTTDLGSPGLALAIIAGAAALMSIATVQWWQLRPHLVCAHHWLLWTPLAWALALPLSFLPGLLVTEDTRTVVQVLVWPVGGLPMAFVMALVTGIGMQRMLRVRNRVAIRRMARA